MLKTIEAIITEFFNVGDIVQIHGLNFKIMDIDLDGGEAELIVRYVEPEESGL